MSAVIDHPTRGRLLNLLRAVDDLPGDPPAMSGLDDLDPDVVAALTHRTDRDAP